MRVLLVWDYPAAYLKSVEERLESIVGGPYEVLLTAFLNDHYGWPAAAARRLAALGVDVEFHFWNASVLTSAWVADNVTARGAQVSQEDALREHARRFRPDVTWVGGSPQAVTRILAAIRAVTRRVVLWVASPQPRDLPVRQVDLVLTSHSWFVDYHLSHGTRAAKLLPAFEERILSDISSTQRDLPLTFIGGMTRAHRVRLRALAHLARETPLELWGTCLAPSPSVGPRAWMRQLWFRSQIDVRELNARYRGPAWGRELYQVLARSLLSFNSHISVAHNQAGNMRMFEATGCGAALLTESFDNLPDLFDPATEVIGYRSEQELVEKAKYYIERPKLARAIGKAGQQRTLRVHNTVARAEELLGIFREVLARPRGRQ